MDADLLTTLELSNPWLRTPDRFPEAATARLPERWVPRALERDPSWPVLGKANLLVGARQVGKSSLLWRRCVTRGTPPLFLNAEEPAVRRWSTSPVRALADLHGLLRPGMVVFVEEAQRLPDAGLFLKGLVDGGLKHELLVTGSSAFHLQAHTRESLAGRAARAALGPLALRELAADLPEDEPPLLRARRLEELALTLAVRGGYPEVWTADDPRLPLRHLIEAFVIRDASDLFQVQHLDAFRRLLQLIAGQVGSLANHAEWASICGVSSDTVARYIDLMVETHVLYRALPFAGGRRAELTHRPKVYFADTGLRNALLRRLEPLSQRVDPVDRGAVFESWVGGELRKLLSPLQPGDELRYWRTRSGAEVDFVVPRPDGLLAYEVKATRLRRPKLTRSARSFVDAYGPRQLFVVNLSLEHRERVGGTEVCWVTPAAFADPAQVGLEA